MRNPFAWCPGWLMRLATQRRAAVAVMVATITPVLLGSAALGLEVGSWSVAKVELQRRADIAAFAAAAQYKGGASTATATAVGTTLAALNGASASGCSYGGNTQTCSDVTVGLVTGVRNATDAAMMAVVSRNIPMIIGGLISSQSTMTIRATAYAEVMTTAGSGGQPCLVSLGGGITVQGGAAVSTSNCTVRSNGGLAVTNGSAITTPSAYSAGSYVNSSCPAGSVCVSGGSSITTGGSHPTTVTPTNIASWASGAPLYENAGTINDPYASNATLKTDFNSLSPGSGTAFNGTWQPSTLSPGTYSSITSGSGNITLNPGTYIVNGNISVGNGAAFTGAGVTIISSGSITFGGGSTVTLSAPLVGASSGIPGVVLAGPGTGTVTLSNGMKPTLTGAVYFPNATISLAGGVTAANSCLEMIGYAITITNGATFGGTCSNYGSAAFTSLPGSSTVAVVQ